MNEFKFLTAKEVAEMLKVSQAKAYEIVRKMNAEMEAMGYMTVRGRINAAYFDSIKNNLGKGGQRKNAVCFRKTESASD